MIVDHMISMNEFQLDDTPAYRSCEKISKLSLMSYPRR